MRCCECPQEAVVLVRPVGYEGPGCTPLCTVCLVNFAASTSRMQGRLSELTMLGCDQRIAKRIVENEMLKEKEP
jgi:hypothetical protein